MSLVHIIELLWLCNLEFKEDIIAIRKELGIDLDAGAENFDPEQYLLLDRKYYSNSVYRAQMKSQVKKFCQKYGLEGFDEEIQTFIETKAIGLKVLLPTTETIAIVRTPRQSEFVQPTCTLLFGDKISPKGLDKWYLEHKKHLLNIANENYGDYKQAYKDIPNFKRVQRIFQLKHGPDEKTFAEIADIICNENPEDEAVFLGKINEDSVKQAYHKYKNYFPKR